jgi:hypothetical protein
MTPETRVSHLEAQRRRDIFKVQDIIVGEYGPKILEFRPTSEEVATKIVDELHPPYWRKR